MSAFPREIHRLGGDVSPDHGLRRVRQLRRPVARAASRVEHPLAAGQSRGERVPRQMLVQQIDIHLSGDDPLTRELSQAFSPEWRRR